MDIYVIGKVAALLVGAAIGMALVSRKQKPRSDPERSGRK